MAREAVEYGICDEVLNEEEIKAEHQIRSYSNQLMTYPDRIEKRPRGAGL